MFRSFQILVAFLDKLVSSASWNVVAIIIFYVGFNNYIYTHPPAFTLEDPAIIEPLSVESPTLAIAIPSAKTVPDPTLIFA
jgi:hypothetical protein